MPKIVCKHCAKEMQGRSDKKYCSIQCKNDAYQQVRKKTLSYVQKIDAILHKNHRILHTLMGDGRKEMQISSLELEAMGFSFNYYTGTYLNSKNKTYHYIYNFSWMVFTKGIIHVYKK